MGGKRPDQIHRDKLSTDYKTRTDDEHINAEDKHELHTRRGKLDAPERGENPALEALKAKRAESQESEGTAPDEG
jgi:hypothetical protein